MPLLHRKSFVKKKIDNNLKPSDKVFFCELTDEVFTDYDEFWERLVLLNALVWTCELTGRPNLTYQEAVECENKARKCISNVSVALKKPLLYISTYTKRGRIADTSDDIFSYIRDRYFVGEEIEAIVSNHWYDCKVTKIILPSQQEIVDYEKSLEDSDVEDDDSLKIVNGNSDEDDGDIIIIRDDHKNKSPDSKKENDSAKDPKEQKEFPPFPTVKYEVIEIEAWDYKQPKQHIVSWDQIRRSKSAFTREKCKLFVKQCMTICPGGYWTLKESIAKSYDIKKMQYCDIFVGNPPKFEETKMKKIPFHATTVVKKDRKLIKQREDKEKREDQKKKENDPKKKEIDTKKKAKSFMSEEAKEEARKMQLELKEKSKQNFRKKLEQMKIERKKTKDLLKEENRLMRLYEQDWWQKKEDLECEDHKDLPSAVTLSSRIPSHYFGNYLMVLDFVNTFADILELGDVYPSGISFEMLEHALVEKEVAGVFNDIIQLLLGAIFSLQEEEDEEVEGDTTMDMASMNFEKHMESKSQMSSVNIANKASTWSQQYQGVSLQKVPLDALTLTEVLRLHILASGATNVANAFWRHMNRGGYKHTDDPGLQFKLDEPEIIKKLTTESLFNLTIEEKVKILTVLVSQIMTYASLRDNIEEKLDRLRELSNHYRAYKWAASRKEKEELIAKKQKLKDIKVKMEKKLLDQRLQTAGEATNDAAKAKVILMEELEEEEEEEKEKETRSSAKKKVESEKQEEDFIDQIESLSRDVRQFSLGQDRAFRRYWLFNRIPGLFVEDLSPDKGSCLDRPTPVRSVTLPEDNSELKKAIKEQAIRNLEILEVMDNKERENEKNSSDKENDAGESSPAKVEMKLPLSEKNLLKTPNQNIVFQSQASKGDASVAGNVYNNTPKTIDVEEEEVVNLVTLPPPPPDEDVDIKELHREIFGLCSADQNCPVHIDAHAHAHAHARPKWSYFKTKEDLEKLIESLNVRGMRESELRDNLLLHKDKILSSLEELPSFQFDYTGSENTPSDMRKALKRNLNFAPGTPIDRILELTLRDMILETEEKIDNGMLGSLKVPERESWRQALVDGTSLSFSNPTDLDWGGKKRINQFRSFLGMEIAEDDLGEMENLVSKDGLTQEGVVKELAIAILQVAQSLEAKYLKAPLAESDKLSKKRRKQEERLKNRFKRVKKETEGGNEDSSSEEEEEAKSSSSSPLPKNLDNTLRTPIERWEMSLMACTSFSQLFLHLATLDNSVTWSRSAVVNKRCRVCRRSSDSDQMLLCDECDGGFHMHCLKPKLKSIPVGDWFCDKCKPKVKPKSPKKQRKIYKEESEEEDPEEEEEDIEEEQEDEEEEDGEEEEPKFINQEFCHACEMGGELVCCDTCPRSFHLDCADLRKIPRGVWSCPLCKEEKENPVSSKRKSKSGKSKKKNKKLKTDQEIEKALKRVSRVRKTFEEDLEEGSEKSPSRRGVKRSLEDSQTDEGGDEFHRDTIEKLLHHLVSHNDSGPFRKPVYKQEVPDYYTKIKKPMDLRTIKIRFNKNKYTSDAEFIADVLLIFQNTQQYYKEKDPEYKAGLKVSKFFMSKVKSYNLPTLGHGDDSYDRPSKKKKQF